MSDRDDGPLLAGLLPRTSIEVDAHVRDWKSAVLVANDLLVRSGAVDDAYGRSMIEMIEMEGPYAVIAPGVALPHARPSHLVHRTELSLVLLREAVAFGHPDNDPVKLVVALAAYDPSAHVQALAALARAIAEPARLQSILSATSASEIATALEESEAT